MTHCEVTAADVRWAPTHCALHAGTDVARKMIILGRECGLAIEMQQVTVESLVPPQLADAKSAQDFMHQLPQVLPHPKCIFFIELLRFCTAPSWFGGKCWPRKRVGSVWDDFGPAWGSGVRTQQGSGTF